MKKLFTSLSFLLFAVLPLQFAQAQGVDGLPFSAFSATGGVEVGSRAIVSFTVGQVATQSLGGSGYEGVSQNEGIQQVFCVPTFDTLRPVVCQYADTTFGEFEGFTTQQPGYFAYFYQGLTEGGCDSLVWLELTVNPVSDSHFYAQAQDVYSWRDVNRTNSGIYYDTVDNVYMCDSVLVLHLSIMSVNPIPEIYAYKDKALMVNHKVNGYDTAAYATYRWYKDGELLIEGPKDSYQPRSGHLYGCYYVEVPADDSASYWVRSNTICIGVTGIGDVDMDPVSLALYPNPIASGNILHVSIDADELQLQGAKIIVYDIQGRKCAEKSAQLENTIQTNFASGVYSVHVILANGKHEARKLVVR